ncbi:hypothetical protein [Mesorhizobium sp.]|uniref:hypothetical protein n=1 Tax=Mesorhizobium sp. TaxID=1871066 RepID=UPI000FE6CC37|nr:hypothetical protein [Mesorhizobium sp.]RWH31606.1 MAG: hypothetical protein EOQ76_07260 [Mesorhizobium sp.]TIR57659.1 MAG: hypothetical protein E5X22_22810 [Mesorhizobium sp.]
MVEEWTITRVVFAPKVAADLLNTMETRIRDLLKANNRFEQDGRNWRIIQDLRAGEGSSVEILCDNPDFNGQPNNAVICCGEWTDWQEIRFTGDSIDDALGAAMVAYTQWSRKNAGN